MAPYERGEGGDLVFCRHNIFQVYCSQKALNLVSATRCQIYVIDIDVKKYFSRV